MLEWPEMCVKTMLTKEFLVGKNYDSKFRSQGNNNFFLNFTLLLF